MSNKDYDQADGVFDIDLEDDEEAIGRRCRRYASPPAEAKKPAWRTKAKVGLSVIAVLLVVFIAVLYRLSSQDDAIVKRSNEPTAPVKTSTAKKTDSRGDQPTVVSPTRQGTPPNPWAADFSSSQSSSAYGKANASSTTDSSSNVPNAARIGVGASDPFVARESSKSISDDQSVIILSNLGWWDPLMVIPRPPITQARRSRIEGAHPPIATHSARRRARLTRARTSGAARSQGCVRPLPTGYPTSRTRPRQRR